MINWFPNILKTSKENLAANIRFYDRLIGEELFKNWNKLQIINKIYDSNTSGVSEEGFKTICNHITKLNSAYNNKSFIA